MRIYTQRFPRQQIYKPEKQPTQKTQCHRTRGCVGVRTRQAKKVKKEKQQQQNAEKTKPPYIFIFPCGVVSCDNPATGIRKSQQERGKAAGVGVSRYRLLLKEWSVVGWRGAGGFSLSLALCSLLFALVLSKGNRNRNRNNKTLALWRFCFVLFCFCFCCGGQNTSLTLSLSLFSLFPGGPVVFVSLFLVVTVKG